MAGPADLLAHLPGASGLDRADLERLAAAAVECPLETGVVLVREGEPAPDWYAVVLSGAVQLSRTDLESDEILEYLTVGDVLDPGAPGIPAPWTAAVAERGRALRVAQRAVTELRARGATADPVGEGGLALFVRRVAELLTGRTVTCPPDTTVDVAARRMRDDRVGSIVVTAADGRAVGIVTDRDLRDRVVAAGLAPSTPVAAIMSAPLVTIAPEALAFDAFLEMLRCGVHHLPVLSDGRLVGVVSSHDLVWLQGAHPMALAREIEAARDVASLVGLGPRTAAVVRWLLAGGARVSAIGRVVAELTDRLTRRLVELAEQALAAEGHRAPRGRFTWLAAGSEGRREQALATDQDNGLVFTEAPDRIDEAPYFLGLAERVAAGLETAGVPRCAGGYMASNRRWCQPERAWRAYVDAWMNTPHGAHVLDACIYVDLRPVAGDPVPGEALAAYIRTRGPSQTLFLRHLARDAVTRTPPLGLFGRLVVERSGEHKDRLDLKARGIFPITQAVRVHALAEGIAETNTLDRLSRLGEREVFASGEVRDVAEAYEVLCRLRLQHQLGRLDAGVPPDNFLDPRGLGRADRLLLRDAFRVVAWLQNWIADRFQTAGLG